MIIPLGHASVLIKYGKFSILIDPVFMLFLTFLGDLLQMFLLLKCRILI